MAMTTHNELESDLEAFFAKKVRAVGGMAIKVVPAGQVGVPDRLVLLPGDPGSLHLVELKTTSGQLRPMQRYFIERAEEMGVPVAVLHGRGEVLRWLRSVMD